VVTLFCKIFLGGQVIKKHQHFINYFVFELLAFLNYLTQLLALDNSVEYWHVYNIQGGSNMTGTDLCVNKPHCAAAVRP